MKIISEIYDFVESVGLNFVSFDYPKEMLKYDVENIAMDDELKVEIKKLKKRDQQAIAELIHGTIIGHNFYISKLNNSRASLQDDIVPYIFGKPEGLQEKLRKHIENDKSVHDFQLNCSYPYGKTSFNLKLPLTETVPHYFDFLSSDHNYTFGEMSTIISTAHDIPEEHLKNDFEAFYEAATKHDIVMLRHKNTGSQNVGKIDKEVGLFKCLDV